MLQNQRDPIATADRCFASKKSYVSFAGHEYLYGVLDHERRRLEIYQRAQGYCQGCATPHLVSWEHGEWHHAQKTLGGRRCDGYCCGMWVCKDWHKRETNRDVQLGRIGVTV